MYILKLQLVVVYIVATTCQDLPTGLGISDDDVTCDDELPPNAFLIEKHNCKNAGSEPQCPPRMKFLTGTTICTPFRLLDESCTIIPAHGYAAHGRCNIIGMNFPVRKDLAYIFAKIYRPAFSVACYDLITGVEVPGTRRTGLPNDASIICPTCDMLASYFEDIDDAWVPRCSHKLFGKYQDYDGRRYSVHPIGGYVVHPDDAEIPAPVNLNISVRHSDGSLVVTADNQAQMQYMIIQVKDKLGTAKVSSIKFITKSGILPPAEIMGQKAKHCCNKINAIYRAMYHHIFEVAFLSQTSIGPWVTYNGISTPAEVHCYDIDDTHGLGLYPGRLPGQKVNCYNRRMQPDCPAGMWPKIVTAYTLSGGRRLAKKSTCSNFRLDRIPCIDGLYDDDGGPCTIGYFSPQRKIRKDCGEEEDTFSHACTDMKTGNEAIKGTTFNLWDNVVEKRIDFVCPICNQYAEHFALVPSAWQPRCDDHGLFEKYQKYKDQDYIVNVFTGEVSLDSALLPVPLNLSLSRKRWHYSRKLDKDMSQIALILDAKNFKREVKRRHAYIWDDMPTYIVEIQFPGTNKPHVDKFLLERNVLPLYHILTDCCRHDTPYDIHELVFRTAFSNMHSIGPFSEPVQLGMPEGLANSCTYQYGVRAVNSGLADFKSMTKYDCCKACREEARCKALTWNRYRCWMHTDAYENNTIVDVCKKCTFAVM